MPKSFDLNQLLPQPEAHTPSGPDYFLFLLGTDTQFVARPTKDESAPEQPTDYDHGETLSYAAQLTAQQLNETEQARRLSPAHAFATASVDLINGPDTLGTEVGDRIAQGLLLALRAVAEGKTTLQLSGHSRGAVEAILIAHELERIKVELTRAPQKTLFQILTASPYRYVQDALKVLCAEINETEEQRKVFANRMQSQQLRVNLFLIDPVPGGRPYYLPLGWHEEQFYRPLPCHAVELLLCRDERSQAFIPIVPEGVNPLLIPGHHGTASGNLYSQGLQTVPNTPDGTATAGVQDLTVLKFLEFTHRNSRLFRGREAQPVALDHPHLDQVVNPYLTAQEDEKPKLMLAVYQGIYGQDQAYRHFASTTYPYLYRVETPSGQRPVHYRGHNRTSLESVVPMLGGHFVNKEHAQLYLSSLADLSFTSQDPIVLMNNLNQLLQQIFVDYKQSLLARPDDLSKSVLQTSHLLKGENSQFTFEAISIFIDNIGQIILNNHLNQAVKTTLLDRLDETFQIFRQAEPQAGAMDELDRKLAKGREVVNQGFKKTVDSFYGSLIEKMRGLTELIQYHSASQQEFEEIFAAFNFQLSGYENTNPHLNDIIQRFRAVMPVTRAGVKQCLNENLESLKNAEDEPSYQLLLRLADKQHSNLESYLAAENLENDEVLAELDRVYENLDSLEQGCDRLKRLYGQLEFQIKADKLRRLKDRAVSQAAFLLKERGDDLHNRPTALTEAFFAAVKPQAIALGAADPQLTDLKMRISELESEIINLGQQAREDQATLLEAHQAELGRLREDYRRQLDPTQQRTVPTSPSQDGIYSHQDIRLENAQLNKLRTPKEIECAHLIQAHLIPLSNCYLAHLDYSAEHSLYAARPEKINTKRQAVVDLLKILESKDILLPSDKIRQFTEKLNEHRTLLSEKRSGISYLKTCLTVIAVTCSGIIPGLLGLWAYSRMTGKSSPLFFAKSHGQEFADEATALTQPAI